jgi:hypothetical protein
MSNLRTAQELYEAFGRGDLATILSKLSESVEWEYGVNGHQPLGALDQFDLVAIRILDERDDRRATFDRPRLARHLAA